MPKPAAAFSPLAITKSSDSRAMSPGAARRTISRPGRPKISPMKRMRMLADRDPDLGPAAFLDARQQDAKLARRERGFRAAGVVGALEPHRAREAAEAALREVERGARVLPGSRQFFPSHDQHVAAEDELQR